MRTRIACTLAEIDRLRGLWEKLQAPGSPSVSGATLFQSFSWNRLAAQCFDDRQSAYVVAVESDSGAALIPACISRTVWATDTGPARGGTAYISLLGEELFDYRNVLAAGDEVALQEAWKRLAELRLPLRVTALRGEEARERWRELQPEPFVSAPQVRRDEVGAENFALAHARLGRTLRRLAREGVVLRHCCGAAVELVRVICRRKAEQPLAPPNLFRDARRVDFLAAAAALAGSACDIFTFERSYPLAALITFRDGDVRRFYTTYFDPAWAQYSPGTALLYEITRRSLAEGLDCDYLTGEQPHKRRFMTSAVPLYRVHAPAAALARLGAEAAAAPPSPLAA